MLSSRNRQSNNLSVCTKKLDQDSDPDLPTAYPLTYKFLSRFKSHLEQRSSLKRFQKGQAFYSLWSTGPYTFSPFKVLWREIGSVFAAAYIGSTTIDFAGVKVVVPDHKLYFIPVDSEPEAAYLTGFLNAPTITKAVSAYAAQLSLGVSIAEYLKIPVFDASDERMIAIAMIARTITANKGKHAVEEIEFLDLRVRDILKI